MPHIRLSQEVREALDHDYPVVGLESTIFSHLGLPSPANEEALQRSTAAIRSQDPLEPSACPRKKPEPPTSA